MAGPEPPPIAPATERRVVSILATDIVGSTRHIATCDPEDAQGFFDRCFDHLRDQIERAGGTLVSYEGDGGIAVFGWPGALEDHADRACAAAWAIQHTNQVGDGPDGRPVQFRIGVHSGLVALRQLRGDGRSRLDTVGAAVHIAAKLQQCAGPGDVLVSTETVQLCRARLRLVPPPAAYGLALAGTDAFGLAGAPERHTGTDLAVRYRSPMIGRQPELALLRKSLPGAGGGSAALIGEPGIGKSRLAAAAVAAAQAEQSAVLMFFGDAQKRTTPFAAARSLLEEAVLRGGHDVRTSLAAAGFVDADTAAVEALLSAPPDRPKPRAARLTDAQLAQLLVAAFRVLAIGRPTLLLIEDLHLIDSESARFLRLLARAETPWPLGLLVTGRPESRTQAEEIVGRVILLEPLPRSAMSAIAKQNWPGGRPPPDALLERLVERADGVPFVLEELVQSVGVKGGDASIALPHTVESLIHARLTRLRPSAKELAQALSLLGENVDIGLAGEVVGADPAALLDDLMELERYAFVHPLDGAFTHMRHQIIAEACADTIPRDRRRQLHRAALEAMTARFPSLAGYHEKLAFHAEGAGELEVALEHLWQAALEARRASATHSLNLIFDRTIGLVGRIGEPAEDRYVDFVLAAFTAMLQLGEFEKMNAHLPRVMERVRQSGRLERLSVTLSHQAMMCWFDGRYVEGLAAADEGLAIARRLDSPILVYLNLLMRTNILHDRGDVQRAIDEQRELCAMLAGSLETARMGTRGVPNIIAQSFLGWFLLKQGSNGEGVAVAERALAVAEREQDIYSQVLTRHVLARHLLGLGRDAEAAECVAVAYQISERNGYDAIKADLAGCFAIALARTGRAAEAVVMAEDCLQRGMHRRTGQFQYVYLHAGYGEALLRLGETERGLAAFDEALATARRIGNPCATVDTLDIRARLLDELRPGDPSIAADRAEVEALCRGYAIAAWPAVTAALR